MHLRYHANVQRAVCRWHDWYTCGSEQAENTFGVLLAWTTADLIATGACILDTIRTFSVQRVDGTIGTPVIHNKQ